MSTKKSVLSENIPEHSTLHDIEPDVFAKSAGFFVEFEDATEPATAPKWDMEIGDHMVICTGVDRIDAGIKYRRNGTSYEVKAQWKIDMEDVNTHDEVAIYVDRTAKAERSFKLAINTRSNGDLQSKIGPAHEVTELSVTSVCAYLSKYPVKMRYDFSEWVDEQGNAQRSKKPKLLLWIPEDFVKQAEHSPNYISFKK